MSGSIYSVCIGPQSSCQSHSEEGAVCVYVCLCARACMLRGKEGERGRKRESCLQPLGAAPEWSVAAPGALWGHLHAGTLRALLLLGAGESAAFLCRLSKHGMQSVQPAEARGAVQITLRSLSGNEPRFILGEWPGTHLAELNYWQRQWGFLCIFYLEWDNLSDISVHVLLSLLGDFPYSGT